ncbi:MAG: hypothetical protein KA885_07285 [Spirochaetes bacterium]|nr:hypothetical protein [Spirochaetota bacterium]
MYSKIKIFFVSAALLLCLKAGFSAGIQNSTVKFAPGVVNIVDDPEILRQIRQLSDNSKVKSMQELAPGDIFVDEQTRTIKKVRSVYADETTNTLKIVTSAPAIEEAIQNYYVPEQEVDVGSIYWDGIEAAEGVNIIIPDALRYRSEVSGTVNSLNLSFEGEVTFTKGSNDPEVSINISFGGTINGTTYSNNKLAVTTDLEQLLADPTADADEPNEASVEKESALTFAVNNSYTINPPTIKVGLNTPTIANPVSGGFYYDMTFGTDIYESQKIGVSASVEASSKKFNVIKDLALIPVDGGTLGGLISLNVQLVASLEGELFIQVSKRLEFSFESHVSVRYTPSLTWEKKTETIYYYALTWVKRKGLKWVKKSYDFTYSVPTLRIQKDLIKNETTFPKRKFSLGINAEASGSAKAGINCGPALTCFGLKLASLTVGSGPYIKLEGNASAIAIIDYKTDKTIYGKPSVYLGLNAMAALSVGPYLNVAYDLLNGTFTNTIVDLSWALLTMEAQARLTFSVDPPYTNPTTVAAGGVRITSPFAFGKPNNEICKYPANYVFLPEEFSPTEYDKWIGVIDGMIAVGSLFADDKTLFENSYALTEDKWSFDTFSYIDVYELSEELDMFNTAELISLLDKIGCM